MSVVKCLQLLPGTLWRWRAALLLLALLSLASFTFLDSLQQHRGGAAPAAPPHWSRREKLSAIRRRVADTDEAQHPEWSDAGAHQQRDTALRRQERSWPDPAGPPPPPPPTLTIPRRRVVHFDLKGAPPRMSYLLSLLPLIRRLGATDLLVEWEDMFPFWGALRAAAARNHYTRVEVRQLLAAARHHGLQVIPLVQTFGHMEPFLKLEVFSSLREVAAHPAALCPSRNQSMQLVQLIIDQVMELHRGARYLHIGCDEVYHMGVCHLCQRRMRDELYLEHVVRVARYARQRHAVTPLVWDDMMRHIPLDVLRSSDVGQLVEPMVWVYAEDVYRFVGPHVYTSFAQIFPRVWAASAYKGAFGETLLAPPLQRHLDNTRNWLTVIGREGGAFTDGFSGLVLTGWQRYDHMAVLCELLPVSVPSLALDLLTASRGFFNATLHSELFEALSCADKPTGTYLNLDIDTHGFQTFSLCMFPGAEYFRFVSQLMATLTRTEETFRAAQTKGWLTDYNIARNFTNPFRVDEVLEPFYSVEFSLRDAVAGAREALAKVVDRYTVAELVEQKVWPWLERLQRLRRDGEALKRRSSWPRRPLPMLQALAGYGLNVTELRPPRRHRKRIAAPPDNQL